MLKDVLHFMFCLLKMSLYYMHFKLNSLFSLCPLGFHPQTRWPTRCKRCFRLLILLFFTPFISYTIHKHNNVNTTRKPWRRQRKYTFTFHSIVASCKVRAEHFMLGIHEIFELSLEIYSCTSLTMKN